MEKSMAEKELPTRTWTARILALLVLSMIISSLVFLNPQNKKGYTKRIDIRTDKDTGEIVTAIEKLGRNNIDIKVSEDYWYWSGKKIRFFLMTVSGFFAFGVLLLIYYAIYCLINFVLHTKRTDESLMRPDEQSQPPA
jgi:hypothetical protein